ncbi:FUSC family protein [Hoeflea sp. WL0058]|uniref:FUSC family protein n=1 Tax=Flavimaribacter sediminis TaxID=2865987 RepID=A0AAE2ZTD8_9HYPH|nr:FUSC family protein [Flavimaribacter sediminis]MBW8640500.1 FUSC family protein [Flavimaribacter sediminis]
MTLGLTRLASFLRRVDPGGLNLVRGLHFGLATILAGCIGYGLHRLAPPGVVPNLTIFCAASAAFSLLFLTPGPKPTEFRLILRNGAVVLAVLLVGAIVGWGSLDPSGRLVTYIWVPVIAFGFYLRRYGVDGTQVGRLMSMMFMFLVIENPDRSVSWWLPLAALIGAGSAIVVRILGWRPSSLNAFASEEHSILSEFARRLRDNDVADQLEVDDLRARWTEFARLSNTVVFQNPQLSDDVQTRVLRVLRILLSGQYIGDLYQEIAASGNGDVIARPDLAALRKDVAQVLLGSDRYSVKTPDEVERIRERLLSSGGGNDQKDFYEFRLFAAYARIFEILQTTGTGKPTPEPRRVWQVNAADSEAANRMAIQGFVAASVTIFLTSWFNLAHGFWATMTVYMVLSGTAGATLQRMTERTIGTAAGAALAILVENTIPLTSVQAATALLALGLVVLALPGNYTIASGLISYTVLIAFHLLADAGSGNALARVYDTFIGAFTGLAAALLIFPVRSVDKIDPFLVDIRSKALDLVHTATDVQKQQLNASVAALEQSSRKLAEIIPEIEAERLLDLQPPKKLRRRLAYADALVSYVTLYVDTRSKTEPFQLSNETAEFLRTVQEQLEKALLPSPEAPGAAADTLKKLEIPRLDVDSRRLTMMLIGIRYYAYKTATVLHELNTLKP